MILGPAKLISQQLSVVPSPFYRNTVRLLVPDFPSCWSRDAFLINSRCEQEYFLTASAETNNLQSLSVPCPSRPGRVTSPPNAGCAKADEVLDLQLGRFWINGSISNPLNRNRAFESIPIGKPDVISRALPEIFSWLRRIQNETKRACCERTALRVACSGV